MNFHLLRNSFIAGSLSVGFCGFLVLFSPYKNLSQFLISSGLGSLAGSCLAIQNCSAISTKKKSKLLAEIDNLTKGNNELADRVYEKSQANQKLELEIKKYHDDINNLLGINSRLEDDLRSAKTDFVGIQSVNFESAVTTLRESLNEVRSQVNNLIPFLSKKFGVDVKNLLEDFNQECYSLSKKIGVISDNSKLSNEDLIACCIAVQHEILSKGLGLKAKLYKSALDKLLREVNSLIPLDVHNEKITAVKDYYSRNLKAVQEEFGTIADGCINAYKSDFQEIVNDGISQSQELETLQNQLLSLNSKLQELSKPLQFVGSSEPARVGNSIINYYQSKLGITLDAIDFSSNETGYFLTFHTSRNNRFLPVDFLNENNNPDKIKELSASLNLPKFVQAERGNYVSLQIETRKPAKKETSKDDVNSMWIPQSKFESFVKRWERVRVTAGSTGGKSPTAKNLALAIMSARQGDGQIKLYDPQHGSKKDFWDMPKAGVSHDDSVKGIKELVTVLDARSKNPGKHQFMLYLFDEIDSTLAKYKGDVKFKDLVVYAISQGSHQDLGMIFIGQSCDANTVPGMTHSHWNNCVQLHIGSNAGLYLDKSSTITTEEKTRLLNQYRKIQEFCDNENDKLGLDIYTDPGAYRFALAVPLTGLPKFIQLPDFDSYDYNEVMVKEVEINCIHCTSTNIKKNGKTGNKQRYSCNDCGKTFSL